MSDAQYYHLNPSDRSAGTPGGRVYGVVLDVKDPKKLGRCLVRPIGLGDGLKTSGEAQWITVNMPGGPQRGGAVGMSPPSSGILPTSVVQLSSLGQQTWEIVGVVPNVDDDNTKGDTHPYTQGKEVKFTSETHNSNPGHPGYQLDASDWRDVIGKSPDEIRSIVAKWQKGKFPIKHKLGKWIDAANKGQMPSDFNFRKLLRNKGKGAGLLPFKGDLTDATKFLSSAGVAPTFSSAYSMIENLLSTANGGKNIDQALSIGGAGNISSAISAAAAFISSINKQNTEHEADTTEAYLRALYREETEKEPIDENDIETQEYKDWKVDYYLRMEYEDETGTSARDADGIPTAEYKAWKKERAST